MILWGTAGAIGVRVALTGVVVWLLKVPGFLFVGGLALVWIGWKLTRDGGDGSHDVDAAASVRGAVQTIIVADAVMGVDNVLAVGGAAHGSFALVLIGVGISIPIVVWGSALVVRLIERYPAILWGGAAVHRLDRGEDDRGRAVARSHGSRRTTRPARRSTRSSSAASSSCRSGVR